MTHLRKKPGFSIQQPPRPWTSALLLSTLCKHVNITCLTCPASNTHVYEKQEPYLTSSKAKENISSFPLHKCSVPWELLQWMAEGKAALATENTWIQTAGLNLPDSNTVLTTGFFSDYNFKVLSCYCTGWIISEVTNSSERCRLQLCYYFMSDYVPRCSSLLSRPLPAVLT